MKHSERRIREKIAEIAGRRRNVTLDEIQWVVNQLNAFLDVGVRENDHMKLFTVGGRRFSICTHKKGSKQIKRVYVDNFLNAMIDLGWYEE